MDDKVRFSPDQLISATQLVRKLSFNLDKALRKPLFIQRNHEVEWVLMSLDEYRKLMRDKKGGK